MSPLDFILFFVKRPEADGTKFGLKKEKERRRKRKKKKKNLFTKQLFECFKQIMAKEHPIPQYFFIISLVISYIIY